MDKVTRTITIIIAAVVAVSAILLAFFLTRARIQNETEYIPAIDWDQKITLVSGNMEYVKSMKISNQYGTYTVVPTTGARTEIGTCYTIEGIDVSMVEAQTVYNIVKYGFNPVATESLGRVENPEEYGLSMPSASISVELKDGAIYEYHIGNAVGKRQNQYYMCAKDSSNVYIITVEPAMLGTVENLMNKTVFSMVQNQNDNEQENEISIITIYNSQLPQGIVFEQIKEDGTYRIQSYPAIRLDQEVLKTIKTNLTDLQAQTVVTMQADEEQLKQYGLAMPDTVISFQVNGRFYQLQVGREENGMRYVKRADADMIYQVAEQKIAIFTKGTLFTLTDSAVYTSDETYFSAVEITDGKKSATITMEPTEHESELAESLGNHSYKIMLNGASMEEKDYNAWIEAVKRIRVQADTDLQAEGEPVLNLTLKSFNTNQTDVLSFYRAGNSILVTVNGMVRGTVTSQTFTLFKSYMPL